jgi:hypothetical protein
MNRLRSTTLLVAVAVGTGLIFGAAPSPAVSLCTLRTIDGTYGYIVNGTNVGGTLIPGPVVAVGFVNADGAGRLTATDTVSVNGTIVRRAISGTYTINSNCTGQLTFADNLGQTTHLDFVVTQDRQEFLFVQTDTGAVTTGTAKKQ